MAWGGQGGRTGPAHEPGGKGKRQRTRTEAMLTCSVDFAHCIKMAVIDYKAAFPNKFVILLVQLCNMRHSRQ